LTPVRPQILAGGFCSTIETSDKYFPMLALGSVNEWIPKLEQPNDVIDIK